MTTTSFTHEFVEFIPTQLDDGVLYVSIPYCTAVHRCACGCGNKVVTPISPVDWQLLFDGDGVSLTPSVGNWAFPCRSHYWIQANDVLWAKTWTPEQVSRGRAAENRQREKYFERRAGQHSPDSAPMPAGSQPGRRRWFPRAFDRWLRRDHHAP